MFHSELNNVPGDTGSYLDCNSRTMALSNDASLVFVLRSGVLGRVTRGRLVHDSVRGLRVYCPDPDEINEYISGPNLRSWCVIGPDARPLPGWCSILEKDRHRILQANAAS